MHAQGQEQHLIIMLSAVPYILLAVGRLPAHSVLSSLAELTTAPVAPVIQAPEVVHIPKEVASVTIGAGIPPIPAKLVQRIEAGNFIEMGELLPERLQITNTNTDVEGTISSKAKYKPVTNIIDWTQCFGLYVAVLSRSQPERVADLLGYQTLIIQAYREYDGDCWLGYDRTFRLRAASQGNCNWSSVDTSLWSLAFSGRGKIDRCKICFSLAHPSSECILAIDAQSSRGGTRSPSGSAMGKKVQLVCYEWNNTPSPSCSYPNCRYEHKCAICTHDPSTKDVVHKAMYCPRRYDRPPPVPLFQKTYQSSQKGPRR